MGKQLTKKDPRSGKPAKKVLFQDLAFWVTVCTDAVHLIQAAAVLIRHIRSKMQEKKGADE